MQLSSSSSALVPLQPGPDNQSVIICIPQAGAGAAPFGSLAVALAGKAAVWAARFPGRESRILEEPLTSIEAMADALHSPVKDIGAGNIVLLGHCSGALVAYELACRLSGEGCPGNVRLAVSSQAPPPLAGGGGPQTAEIIKRPLDIAAELRAMGGTPEELLQSDEFMELLAPAIHADFTAAEKYTVPVDRPKLGISITVLCGRADRLLSGSGLRDWGNYTTGELKVEYFDGDHFFLYEQESAVRTLLWGLLDGDPDEGRAS